MPQPHELIPTGRPRSGAHRVLDNLTQLLGGKAGAALLSLVYLVIVAHQLGVRDYGVLVLVNGYALLVGGVVAFSGFHGVVRYGAQALAADDRMGLVRIVRLMTALELGCGAAAIAIAMAAVPFVGPRLGWSPTAVRLAVPYSFAVLATVRQTPQGLLQLAGRFDLIALHQLVSPLVRLAGSVILWWSGAGLYGFLIVWLASSICEGLSMWLLALPAWRRLAPGERLFGRPYGAWNAPDDYRRFVLVTNFDLTLRELTPNLAPLTVGWLLGPTAAGLLAIAQRATNILQQPGLLLAQASYPVLAEQAARHALDEVRQTVRRSALLALTAALPAAALIALCAHPFLLLIGGRGFAAAAPLLLPMAAARALGIVAVPLTSGLIASGHPEAPAAVSVLANLALYPLLPLFLWRWHVEGASLHALMQSLVALLIIAALSSANRIT